ncbi:MULTISPECIES: DoxX family protein [Rhodanobacter]|uniref:DoxX family protein n=1 Tax=Rhodanobacter TaxID=75309 RepID=UPI0004016B10|nr:MULTISPECIES: DoxX family protein [Rhodanobacter]TAN18196.1 MAG: DoxX family protein [Rhodanobacter sp.]UJJ53341.1 DoxX family protein [Rhodanobacter thiooxydans]
MNKLLWRTSGYYRQLAEALSSLGPVVLLLFRVWVALAFWRAGVVKLDDPAGTSYLFNNEYHVPLLSGDAAAFLGTWIELVAPWFLLLGLGGRLTAGFLFIYNIMAVVSYPDLWPHGFWAGLVGNDFSDHKVWAMMLLAVIAWGPGPFSLDRILERLRPAARRGDGADTAVRAG